MHLELDDSMPLVASNGLLCGYRSIRCGREAILDGHGLVLEIAPLGTGWLLAPFGNLLDIGNREAILELLQLLFLWTGGNCSSRFLMLSQLKMIVLLLFANHDHVVSLGRLGRATLLKLCLYLARCFTLLLGLALSLRYGAAGGHLGGLRHQAALFGHV